MYSVLRSLHTEVGSLAVLSLLSPLRKNTESRVDCSWSPMLCTGPAHRVFCRTCHVQRSEMLHTEVGPLAVFSSAIRRDSMILT